MQVRTYAPELQIGAGVLALALYVTLMYSRGALYFLGFAGGTTLVMLTVRFIGGDAFLRLPFWCKAMLLLALGYFFKAVVS